jgi:ABC-type dipeptide/oligopeptide/nickel transport system ATPase component
VSIRSGVLALLAQLKKTRGLAILLITHDLAAARLLADRIAVLHRGTIVEEGPTRAVIDAPAHPYTRALLGAIAGADPLPAPPGRGGSAAAAKGRSA